MGNNQTFPRHAKWLRQFFEAQKSQTWNNVKQLINEEKIIFYKNASDLPKGGAHFKEDWAHLLKGQEVIDYQFEILGAGGKDDCAATFKMLRRFDGELQNVSGVYIFSLDAKNKLTSFKQYKNIQSAADYKLVRKWEYGPEKKGTPPSMLKKKQKQKSVAEQKAKQKQKAEKAKAKKDEAKKAAQKEKRKAEAEIRAEIKELVHQVDKELTKNGI